MTVRCRKGHDSDDADYCSVCGSAIGPTAFADPHAPAGQCPSCAEPRTDPQARFCEVCRFDFVAGRPGGPPRVAAPRWAVLVEADGSLDVDPDPETPFVSHPPRTVPFDRAELLVGREDAARDIRPEIALDDPGASRRHAKLVAHPDGSLFLQDLASTNGTKLNGVEVAPGSRHLIAEGDQITLGRWTRLRPTRRA